jgi:leucyl aminopeptidase
MRKAVSSLLGENPPEINVAVYGDATQRQAAAALALYTAWVNGEKLPERKKKKENSNLRSIVLHGLRSPDAFTAIHAQAEGNVLCRELTVLPPNELTPGAYAQNGRGRVLRGGARQR